MVERLVLAGEKLYEFLRRATLGGKIMQASLLQKPTGYTLCVQGENVVGVAGTLNKSCFKTFGNVGDLYVGNAPRLIKTIKDFKADVCIEVRDGWLMVYTDSGASGDEFSEKMVDKEYIESNFEMPDITWDAGFNIGKTFFEKLSGKAAVLDVKAMTLSVNGNILTGIVGDQAKFKVRQEMKYKDAEAKYGRWLLMLHEFVEDTVNVSFDKDFPIRVVSKNQDFLLEYMIAPFVSSPQPVEAAADVVVSEQTETV